MRPPGALPTAEAAWATPGRELAAVFRGDAAPVPAPTAPAGRDTRRHCSPSRLADSQTTRRCRGGRSNGHSASREPRRPGRPREPASRLRCGLLRRWTRARASGPGRSDRLIAGPQGSAAHDPARAILTPTATGLAPKAGRRDASTLFPELRSLKQAPPSGLPTGLDQGQEPGWTVATVPKVELQEAAERGSWSLLSLSPSAPGFLSASLRGVSVTCHQESQLVQGATKTSGSQFW